MDDFIRLGPAHGCAVQAGKLQQTPTSEGLRITDAAIYITIQSKAG